MLGQGTTSSATDLEPDFEASEGRLLTRIHRARERNQGLVRRKKQQVLRETGALRCEACGFDFAQAYGALGEGFAECHHLIPLAKLRPRSRTQLKDLAILCANCHRMIHKNGGITIAALKRQLTGTGVLAVDTKDVVHRSSLSRLRGG